MAGKVKIWYDPEADFLEVSFSEAVGYMRETTDDAVMERVDDTGGIVGFSILGVSKLEKNRTVEVELHST